MWWLFLLVVLGLLAWAALDARRRAALLVLTFALCLMSYVVAASYLGLLYQSAPKDAGGEVAWTPELADRVRDTMAVMYAAAVGLVSSLFFGVYALWQYSSERRWL